MLENLATGDIFRIFTVLEQVSADIKIKVMTQAISYSHKELEFYIYKLRDEGHIYKPGVVEDLITCIKTHKTFEFK